MIADINNGFWIDVDDEENSFHAYMLGYAKVVDIMLTKTAIECNLCNKFSTQKYTSIFVGSGLTFQEMKEVEESNFNNAPPPPRMYPVIDQSDDLDKLKSTSIKYLEWQFHAYHPGKKDWERKIEHEEKVLSSLVERYMNMFSIKNYLN